MRASSVFGADDESETKVDPFASVAGKVDRDSKAEAKRTWLVEWAEVRLTCMTAGGVGTGGGARGGCESRGRRRGEIY